jgi:hypothetical protein
MSGVKVDGVLKVANVIPQENLTGQTSANSGPDADRPIASAGGAVQTAQSLLGFLIAGFAAALSFIGIKSTELASILRNQETRIGLFVALPFLFGIITAILSIFKGRATHKDEDWPTNRLAIASLLFLFAIVLSLPAFIRIPFTTTDSQWIASIIVSAMAIIAAVGMAFRKGSYGKARDKWRSWSIKPFNLQLYLILASVLFLTTAVYAALRMESASQATPTAQLDGSVTVAKNGSAVLSLSVASTKVPVPDRIDITVTALPRTVTIAEICKGTRRAQNPLSNSSCAADPCSYRRFICQSLAGWGVPPDATGAIREILTLPFSSSAYQRLHIEDSLCERGAEASQCTDTTTGGTHLDIQIPAPSP